MGHYVVNPDEPSLSSLFFTPPSRPEPYEVLGADGDVPSHIHPATWVSSNCILAGPGSTVIGTLGLTAIPHMHRQMVITQFRIRMTAVFFSASFKMRPRYLLGLVNERGHIMFKLPNVDDRETADGIASK